MSNNYHTIYHGIPCKELVPLIKENPSFPKPAILQDFPQEEAHFEHSFFSTEERLLRFSFHNCYCPPPHRTSAILLKV